MSKDFTGIKSFKDMFNTAVKLHADSVLFEKGSESMTYGKFSQTVLNVANNLTRFKQKKILIIPNDIIWFGISYLATVISGNIAVLISPLYKEFAIERYKPVYVIDDNSVLNLLAPNGGEANIVLEDNINSPCTILHSSGTTADPKGVVLSQLNICSNVVAGLEKYRIEDGDRLINILPYYHAFGLVCDFLAPFLAGATIVQLADKRLYFSLMSEIEPTQLNIPPIIADMMLKLIDQANNPSVIVGSRLKKILCGGAGLKSTTAKRLRSWGINACGCYGLSECSPCVAVNSDNNFKSGSAGIALSCNSIKIGDDGEILVKGTNVMLGYADGERIDRRVIDEDGYLHTGDIGYVDSDGFLFLAGRKDNVIVFEDGTKCYPEEIEEKIVNETSVVEALVYSEIRNDCVKLCTLLYVLSGDETQDILMYLKRLPLHHGFDNIQFTNTPLMKNHIGKLVRKICR